MNRWDRLWLNVNLATLSESRQESFGAIPGAAIAVANGRIAWLGPRRDLPEADCHQTIDGRGAWVTPGLIDCHTHLVYGGDRAAEFEQRLAGASYEEIAEAGGGIMSTVNATRRAGLGELTRTAAARLEGFIAEGLTGIEIKSGYGLERDSEFRMLEAAAALGERYPVAVSRTFLGAHALPPEFDDADSYVDYLCSDLIPEVAAGGLADAVDVFCERIAFDLPQCEKIFRTARRVGLPVKAHAEQLSNMGGAALASRYGALSADHLEYLDQIGIDAMAEAGTVAVLLPGAFYFLAETRRPPVAALRRAGVAIAVASDCNPGSAPVHSLLLMLNMACVLFGLTPEESLRGVTANAARALGWQRERGTLDVGKRADFVLWDVARPGELAYTLGRNPCLSVVTGGEITVGQ